MGEKSELNGKIEIVEQEKQKEMEEKGELMVKLEEMEKEQSELRTKIAPGESGSEELGRKLEEKIQENMEKLEELNGSIANLESEKEKVIEEKGNLIGKL